jgi:hypothetical protein
MTDFCMCFVFACLAVASFLMMLFMVGLLVGRFGRDVPDPEGIDKYDPFEDLTNHCWLMSENIDLSETERQAYQQAAGQIEAAHSLVQKAVRAA